MAEYDSDFRDQVQDSLNDENFQLPSYSFALEPDGFKMPPVLEVLRFMRDLNDGDAQERNCRWCLMDRTVRLKVNGQQVGSGFTFSDMNAPWDIYPEIKANPLALKFLFELTGAFVLKNSMLSLKQGPVATANPVT